MLCVLILYISGGTFSLKSIPNHRFFEKLFMAILFTLRVLARNLLRGNRRRNTFRILSWCLAWHSNPGFSSNKPTHYLLDHGDFKALGLLTWINGDPYINVTFLDYIKLSTVLKFKNDQILRDVHTLLILLGPFFECEFKLKIKLISS